MMARLRGDERWKERTEARRMMTAMERTSLKRTEGGVGEKDARRRRKQGAKAKESWRLNSVVVQAGAR
jgi:hypothetical protein